jgi:hypothetical protein
VGEALGRKARNLIYGALKARWAKPFFCGKIHDMLFGLMFRSGDDLEVRFAFNAQGGGPGCPAWDYQAIVPNPKPGQEYSFRVRLVYKPFESLEEMARLYSAW